MEAQRAQLPSASSEPSREGTPEVEPRDNDRRDVWQRHADVEAAVDSRLTRVITNRTPPTTVAAAWAQNDYERVVELASQAIEESTNAPALNDVQGVRRLCSTLQIRFKAYQALRLLSLAVSDANRTLALLSQFGITIQDDTHALPGGLGESGAATNSNQRGLKRSVVVERCPDGGKRPRTDGIRDPAPITILSLPTEVLLAIADYLDPPDRIHLANSNRGFRNICELWQHLVFVRIKRLERAWVRDTIEACVAAIETCHRKSAGTLTSVTLKGFILLDDVAPILEALRPSAQTLTHLALATRNQERCYKELYQYCPNLESVDIRCAHQPSEEKSIERMCYDTYMFTKTPWPFKLKYFFANPDVDCGPFESHHPHVPFVPHMKGIEVVHGINFWRQRDPGFAAAIDLMAPTLREWIDRPGVTWSEDHFERDETPKDVGKDLVFPRLLKLNGVWSEVWTRCEFPALQELTYNALRTRFTTTQLAKDQPVNVISRSPSLKRLDILLPLLDSATKKIMWAIAELQHLKELNLWFRYTGGLTLKGLVEFQMDGDDSQTPVRVILPKLHTLGIFIKVSSLSTESFFVHDLCQFLCHRFFLLQGCSRDEAKKRAEAALYLYERTSQRQNKPSRKKHSTEGVALASESAYKGEFETRDDVTRERFTPVLPLLVSNPSKKPGKEKMICMPNPLLDQLVGNYAELDIDPEFVTIPKRMS